MKIQLTYGNNTARRRQREEMLSKCEYNNAAINTDKCYWTRTLKCFPSLFHSCEYVCVRVSHCRLITRWKIYIFDCVFNKKDPINFFLKINSAIFFALFALQCLYHRVSCLFSAIFLSSFPIILSFSDTYFNASIVSHAYKNHIEQ